MALELTVSAASKELHKKITYKPIQYGTAGFRTIAADLEFVMYRMGILAVLRSKATKAVIGMMITASHNPVEDNGVKLIDPHGEMLDQNWEKFATKLVNVGDEQIESILLDIIRSENIQMCQPAIVFVGRDTRPSGQLLLNAALDGIRDLKGEYRDFGVVTTPMLHFFVDEANKNNEVSESFYFSKLSQAFRQLCEQIEVHGNYTTNICFDGANGVGAIKMKALAGILGEDLLKINIYNSGDGILNYGCGADYVKVQQLPPKGLSCLQPGERGISVDGDADRVVYFYLDANNAFHLLDGDRIASLVADYINELLQECNLKLDMGVVQTAYANGASTKYLTEKLKVPVACAPTGVKHLHHEALKRDIGVYFEANGHGTVVVKNSALELIKKTKTDESLSAAERKAASKLEALLNVINQAVGDALSDILLVEAILRSRGWNVTDWEKSYADLPNRQRKVKVQDRNVIKTADAERKCTTPAGLQEEIDKIVETYNSGRSFVRASGTEDVVRVYAEADSQENADELAAKVAVKVHLMAGGVGDAPSL